MLFNSLEFLLFFSIIFLLYWFVFNKNLKLQNLFLLLISYYFYSRWDWRFVFLLFLSTLIGFVFGIIIYNSSGWKRSLSLWIGVSLNILILGFFKYYNFFTLSAVSAMQHLGWQVHPYLLSIALPIGLSFYTFHGLSYILDINKGDIKPVNNFIDYGVFVSFFPLLVAGPIERATHLLPQVLVKRRFTYNQAVAGMRLILWGYFKKLIIADSSSSLVSTIFNSYHTMSAFSLVMGAILFAFQVYGDFSGYSDIARGVAKLLGFELVINFNFPYYSKSLSEFWRRWHISLNTWFVDYVYMPIAVPLRHWGKWAVFLAIFVSFSLSGLWHGAAWNYIAWGILHACALMFEILTARRKQKIAKKLPVLLYNFFCRFFSMTYVLFTYIFFRSRSIRDAIAYLKDIFTHPLYSKADIGLYINYSFLPFIFIFLYVIEYINRKSDNIAPFFDKIKNTFLRYSFYLLLIILICLFGTFEKTSFIYFQF